MSRRMEWKDEDESNDRMNESEDGMEGWMDWVGRKDGMRSGKDGMDGMERKDEIDGSMDG